MLIKDNRTTLSLKHRVLLTQACIVVACEIICLIIFHKSITNWVSHNLWVVLIPFTKVAFKTLIALKLGVVINAFGVLLLHSSKFLALKCFNTLGVRYGIFFTQKRWYWVRRTKVMFLRRGKQFFRAWSRFWLIYSNPSKAIIAIAFFPIIILFLLLGLSFNITRKTIVQKKKETAVDQMSTHATIEGRGLKAWIIRLDRKVLDKIRGLNSLN